MSRRQPHPRPRPVLPRHLQLSFTTFVERHQVVWLKFAHLNVGSNAAAEQIVDEVTAQLAENWASALAQDSVERYALNLVKTEIVRWHEGHGKPGDFVANASFLRAIRDGQGDFALLEESLGLYSAIAQLPERQYTVIVLRFVLGYSDRDVALLLDISVTTVRTHVHHARRRLARELFPHSPEIED